MGLEEVVERGGWSDRERERGRKREKHSHSFHISSLCFRILATTERKTRGKKKEKNWKEGKVEYGA